MIFNIVNGTNKGREKTVSCVDVVNFYPEIEDPSKSKHPRAFMRCPGYRLAVNAGTGRGRGLFPSSVDRIFTVVSNSLAEITSEEVAVVRGTLLTVSGMCSACDNGTQFLIVDGTYGYIFNLSTNHFARITDEDFPAAPTHCVFTDGYFLVNSYGTGKFYFSQSYDGYAWESLDFATAEYSADTLQGIIKTSNGTIWMIGRQSTELWQNVGIADLPWNRVSGSVREIGCIAPFSIASNGDRVFWVGNGVNGYAGVYMGAGYDIARISTPAVEYQLKNTAELSSTTAFVYTDEGHTFYVLSITSELTMVYDTSSGEWHRRGSYNDSTGLNIRQFALGCAFLNGKFYVGSYLNGNVYEMSLDLLDEAGIDIVREIETSSIANENQLLRHSSIEIQMGTGIGNEGGSEPSIMCRFSDDGGNTWSNELTASAGKMGEFGNRVVFDRLGMARNRSYRFRVSAAARWVITALFIR